MIWRAWAFDIGKAFAERAAAALISGAFIWWTDDLRAMVDGVAEFMLMVAFLYGLAWLFIGMACAILDRPVRALWLLAIRKAHRAQAGEGGGE